MKKALFFFFLFFGVLALEPSIILKTYAQMAGEKLTGIFDDMEEVAPRTTLKNIRFGAHLKNTRIFFDLTELPDYRVVPKPKEMSVEIQFFDTKINPELKNISLSDKNIRQAEVRSDENQVTVIIFLKSWKNSFVYLPLSSPARLALDIRGTGHIKASILKTKPKELEVKPGDIQYIKKEINADKILNEDKARLLYIEAMQQFGQMKIDEAKKSLKKLIYKYPHYPFNDSAMYTYGLLLASEAGTKLDENKYDPEKFREAYHLYTEMMIRFPDTAYRQDVYFANARMLMELSLFTEAVAQLDLLIDDFPRDKYTPRALGQKAFILMEQGYIDQAIKVINKLVAHYGDSSGTKESAFRLADTLFENERYFDSFDIYLESIKHWPEYFKMNPSSIFYLAEIYFMNKDYDIAQDYYFRITNLFPKNINAGMSMNRLSQIYSKKKDYSGSLKVLLEAKEKYKDSATGQESLIRLADLGVQGTFTDEEKVFHNLPELQNPFKTYEEVIKNTTYDRVKEEALYSSGIAFTESRQFQKSIKVLQQMLQEYPETKYKDELMQRIKKNFRDIIDIYNQQDGFFTVLLTYYRNFEQFLHDIDDPKIIMAIARSYGELGVYKSAEHFLKKVEKLDSNKVYAPIILKSRIDMAINQKKNKKAVVLANRFLMEYPNNSRKNSVLRSKGEIYSRMKIYKKAAVAYLQAMALDNSSPAASETSDALGDVFYATKKYPEAERAYLEAISIFEKSKLPNEKIPEYVINNYQKVANVLFLQKKYEEAIAANQMVLTKFPDFPAADISTFQIAESYYRLKKIKEASKYYEEVINKYPNTTAASTAEINLREMIWEEENRALLTVKPRKTTKK